MHLVAIIHKLSEALKRFKKKSARNLSRIWTNHLSDRSGAPTMCYVGKEKAHFGNWLYWQLINKAGSKSKASSESGVSMPLISEWCKLPEPMFRTARMQADLARYLGLSVEELTTRWRTQPVAVPPVENRGRRSFTAPAAETIRYREMDLPLDVNDATKRMLEQYIRRFGESALRDLVYRELHPERR